MESARSIHAWRLTRSKGLVIECLKDSSPTEASCSAGASPGGGFDRLGEMLECTLNNIFSVRWGDDTPAGNEKELKVVIEN